ncbi:MAG: TIGR02302 family protein [Aestuariivirga sp.]
MEQNPRRRIERKIMLARLGMVFEAAWSALLWPLVIAAVAVAAIVSGLVPRLPEWPRYGLLIALALAFGWSFRSLATTRWPSREAAMRRLERQSSLSHRPVSTYEDGLAPEAASEEGRALWEAHKFRILEKLKNLRAGTPRSTWRDLDPNALRVPALLLLAASLFLGAGSIRGNLADTVRLAPKAAAIPVTVDAWLKPPAYTGKPPLMLTSPAMTERLKAGGEILVPENSGLSVQVNGATQPMLRFFAMTGKNEAGAELTDVQSKVKLDKGQLKAEAQVPRPSVIKVFDGATELASWPVAVIPDAPPQINFRNEPKSEALGNLTIDWHASDDYGVASVTSEIGLSDNQEDGMGFATDGVFLFDAPEFPVALKRAAPKKEDGASSANLSAHPWAGLMVEMTLEAKDAAGRTGKSETKTFKLPERLFVHPLAKALVEQRKQLVLDPENAAPVKRLIDALLIYPDGLVPESGVHVSMASISSRLGNVESHDDIKLAIDLLWQTALAVEDGDLAGARAELEALRKELQRALAEGAPPERIKELMKKMREAMDKYMRQLAEESLRRQQQGQDRQQQRQAGREISPQDLQKMMDMIEKLAESGANEAAQDLLAQLDEILRNLQPGQPRQAGPSQDGGPMSEMLDKLTELMRKQQQLMDETQRLPQPGAGDPSGEEGNEPGANGQRGDPNGLAGEQESLGDLLDQMMRQLGQNGLSAPESFGDAGREMDGAADSLRRSDRDQALGQQGDALSKLREGAQEMARQMLQQGMGQAGADGQHGEARGDQDPLGRPLPYSGENHGPDRDMVPGEEALRRAREILEMLRSRANMPELPKLDRDYLDRLLRGLY